MTTADSRPPGWIVGATAVVSHTIIWGNSCGSLLGASSVDFSCIQGGKARRERNRGQITRFKPIRLARMASPARRIMTFGCADSRHASTAAATRSCRRTSVTSIATPMSAMILRLNLSTDRASSESLSHWNPHRGPVAHSSSTLSDSWQPVNNKPRGSQRE